MANQESRSEDVALFLGGFLLGIAGGVLAGILAAPKSGPEIRDDFWVCARSLQGKMNDEFNNPDGDTRRFFQKTKLQVENQFDKLQRARSASKIAKAKRSESSELEGDEGYPIEYTGYIRSPKEMEKSPTGQSKRPPKKN